MNKLATQPHSLFPQSLELLESVFDTIPTGIVVYSEDGDIRTHVNQAFCDFIGYSRNEVLTENYGNLSLWSSNRSRVTASISFPRTSRV
jgi:PAS domain S-box-containing protein